MGLTADYQSDCAIILLHGHAKLLPQQKRKELSPTLRFWRKYPLSCVCEGGNGQKRRPASERITRLPTAFFCSIRQRKDAAEASRVFPDTPAQRYDKTAIDNEVVFRRLITRNYDVPPLI